MTKIASAIEHMLTQCIALSKDPSTCHLDGSSLFSISDNIGCKKSQYYISLTLTFIDKLPSKQGTIFETVGWCHTGS